MTDQHDAREALPDCACGNSYLAIRTDIYKDKREFIYCDCCGAMATRSLWCSALAANQPTKPEQQAAGVPAMEVAGWRYWTKDAGFCLSYYEHEARDKNFDSEFYAVEAVYVLAAPSQSAVQPLSEAQIEVLRFLDGVGGLRGFHFGDKPPTERGNYWWRKDLRAAFPEVDFGIVTKEIT